MFDMRLAGAAEIERSTAGERDQIAGTGRRAAATLAQKLVETIFGNGDLPASVCVISD
jgi:hypothetical protein